MKNIITDQIFKPWSLYMIILFGTLVATAQTPGIPYQAYIIDTNSGFAPGGQIDLPLANKEITLRFEIRDENGAVEYTEQKTLTTDEYAMVSTVVGVGGTVLYGTFDGIKWNGTPKKMHIDIKFPGTAFQDHGEMDIIYIPSPGGTQTEKGTGPPSPTNPADPKAGDIYVNETTGEIFIYNGTKWVNQTKVVSADKENIVVEGTDGLAFLDNVAIKAASGVSSGIGAPAPANPVDPKAGNIYVDESTGDLYTYDGTKWVRQPEPKVSTNTGTPTTANPANPTAGDMYVDKSTGDIYSYDGTKWVNQSSEALTVLSVKTNDNGTAADTTDDFDELIYKDEKGTENKVNLSSLVKGSETLTILSVKPNDNGTAADTPAAKDYYITGTPTYFLLDENNKILARPNSVEHANVLIDFRL